MNMSTGPRNGPDPKPHFCLPFCKRASANGGRQPKMAEAETNRDQLRQTTLKQCLYLYMYIHRSRCVYTCDTASSYIKLTF